MPAVFKEVRPKINCINTEFISILSTIGLEETVCLYTLMIFLLDRVYWTALEG